MTPEDFDLFVNAGDGYSFKVIKDSISTRGNRLVTGVARYWRPIHSELMTYRKFSRNAASSRAIPIKKMLAQVKEDPSLPLSWGKNQSGMQSREDLDPEARAKVWERWLLMRDDMVRHVEALSDLGLHKQVANRGLETFAWMLTLITSTDFDNLLAQRCHPDAQPEFQHLAREKMLVALNNSTPELVADGDWHLPFILPAEGHLALDVQQKCSAARCARISYNNADGTSVSVESDLATFSKLSGNPPHPSPFEHQATPDEFASANFTGWRQLRASVPNEVCTDYKPLKKWCVVGGKVMPVELTC